MDHLSVLVGVATVLLALDLLVSGGALTSSAASGMCAAVGTPWGWLGALALLALALMAVWPRLAA